VADEDDFQAITKAEKAIYHLFRDQGISAADSAFALAELLACVALNQPDPMAALEGALDASRQTLKQLMIISEKERQKNG
jgi:hypothetical protein